MRGIFSTGVLDAFLANDFNPFDICIGVSAGANNIAAYLAGMYQRNLKVYTDYSLRPEFINWKKFLRGGHLLDLDWLWPITLRELGLNTERIFSGPSTLYIGVTDASSGIAHYIRPTKDDLPHVMKASSAFPGFYRHAIRVGEIDCVDGGLAAPIPVEEAARLGAKKIVVLRSRPRSYQLKASFTASLFGKRFFKKQPGLQTALQNRPAVYQASLDFIRLPPPDIQVIEVNPPEDFRTGRLTKDLGKLKADYQTGFDLGLTLLNNW